MEDKVKEIKKKIESLIDKMDKAGCLSPIGYLEDCIDNLEMCLDELEKDKELLNNEDSE